MIPPQITLSSCFGLNLAAIGYTMLHTTGEALMDRQTADLAASCAMKPRPLTPGQLSARSSVPNRPGALSSCMATTHTPGKIY